MRRGDLGDDASVYGRKLGEFKMQCPYCGGDLTVTEVEYDVPIIGKVLIASKRCLKCGYKRNDIIPLEQHGHKRLYLKVEAPEDFEVKVVRSPTAKIIIPELGMELEPGIDAEMFVTNVEGVLYMFLDAIGRIKALDPQVDVAPVENTLRNVIQQQRGGFTIILEDTNGTSLFLSEKRKILVLSEEVG